METATISLQLDPDTAQAYQSKSDKERRQLQLLLNLRLRELTAQPSRPLTVIMDDIGREAEARGMTPEILQTLLGDD
jgi:hypothetical protein